MVIPTMNEQPNDRQVEQQAQNPGIEHQMFPRPEPVDGRYFGSGKLQGKVALITGGDSGIGRAIAIAYAKEGADIAIVYLDEHEDAMETQAQVEEIGRRFVAIAGDLGDESFCQHVVKMVIDRFGRVDILVNNAAEQHPQESIEKITAAQLERTFRTNIFAMFYLTKAALPYMDDGSAIINSTSQTAYRGNASLIDYSATKGAIVAFTRSLSQSLISRNIRVNAVAPGPVWTPLITATCPEETWERFGAQVPMQRAGQPREIAPSYVFLASQDASYMSGQVLHPNGGDIVNG
jgi:NAD(P)-dependent dehydrogenase (short-subunit alcohol dehydrogenase family)